jgi:hypothetical protein
MEDKTVLKVKISEAVKGGVVAFVDIPGSFHNLRFVVFARGFHVRKRFVFIITLQIYI